MRAKYSKDVDILKIRFNDAVIDESDEDKPGIILGYDKAGNIVGIEILNASGRVQDLKGIDYEVAG